MFYATVQVLVNTVVFQRIIRGRKPRTSFAVTINCPLQTIFLLPSSLLLMLMIALRWIYVFRNLLLVCVHIVMFEFWTLRKADSSYGPLDFRFAFRTLLNYQM